VFVRYISNRFRYSSATVTAALVGIRAELLQIGGGAGLLLTGRAGAAEDGERRAERPADERGAERCRESRFAFVAASASARTAGSSEIGLSPPPRAETASASRPIRSSRSRRAAYFSTSRSKIGISTPSKPASFSISNTGSYAVSETSVDQSSMFMPSFIRP